MKRSSRQDLDFIKEMIDHVPRGQGSREGEPEHRVEGIMYKDMHYNGRNIDKHFLYEIISNETNGIDVDKFDYFMRDAVGLHISTTFDSQRLMRNCRVATYPEDGRLHIAFQVMRAKDQCC